MAGIIAHAYLDDLSEIKGKASLQRGRFRCLQDIGRALDARSKALLAQRLVAVRTPVAQRPPRGSVRALISAHGFYRG
jgi:hypothetical protein